MKHRQNKCGPPLHKCTTSLLRTVSNFPRMYTITLCCRSHRKTILQTGRFSPHERVCRCRQRSRSCMDRSRRDDAYDTARLGNQVSLAPSLSRTQTPKMGKCQGFRRPSFTQTEPPEQQETFVQHERHASTLMGRRPRAQQRHSHALARVYFRLYSTTSRRETSRTELLNIIGILPNAAIDEPHCARYQI